MRSLGAAGLLLRRLRTELAMILFVAVLVAGTSFVFAAAPRLLNRVFDAALQYAAQVARPADRNVSLVLDSQITPGSEGGITGLRSYGDDLAGHAPRSITALVANRADRFTTIRLYVPEPRTYETHISLRYQDGLTDATRLVAGRWPVDRGVPLHTTQPVSGTPDQSPEAPPVVVEVALATDEATEIGVGVGDRVAVTLDGSDPLVRVTRATLTSTELEIVGLFEPVDASATYWTDDTDLLQVTQHGDPDAPIAYATAYVAPDEYPSLWASELPFHFEWRMQVDPLRFDADQVAQLEVDLRRLGFIAGSTSGASGARGTVVILTGLPGILERYAAERALSESVLSIAAIGPFGLAGGALAMVAILLVRQRRGALTLARGRGASGALLLGTQLWEASVLAGGAALVGLLGAITLVDGRASALSPVLAVAVAGLAILLLVGASWPLARRPLGALGRDDAPVLRVPPRRLVIEMTIVAIAAGAALLLRQRGLTLETQGGLARADPLLASVPVLGGLAAGIVTLRLYPLPVRALGWLAARRPDFVPVIGLRTIGRLPAAANLPLLVLMLTAAFGAFASVIASSLDRGQVTASYLAVGADFTVASVGLGALVPSSDPAAIPGVQAVAPGFVDTSAAFAGRPTQRGSIYLEAIEPAAYQRVTAETAADPRWPAGFLAEVGSGAGTEEHPIPAILSVARPFGTPDLTVGDTFSMTVNGRALTFQIADVREAFAGVRNQTAFAIVPLTWIQVAFGAQPLAPTVLWVRAPTESAAGLAADFPEARGVVHFVSRYEAYGAIHDAPLGAVIGTGYAAALALAALYMALTIVGAMILSAARRTRDLAYLRTLGVTTRQALALTIVEQAVPVVLAIVPGVMLGIVIAVVCEPGLGLATFVGSSGVPLFVDWVAIGLIVGGLTGVVAVAVIAGTWLSRRARLADTLRVGED